MLWCAPFIHRTITKEVSWFQGGNHQDWRGSKFPLSFVHEFLSTMNIQHTTYKSPCSNLALFRVHLPYLGDYVHFLGINAHNSSSNNRCIKGPQERPRKPCSCHLVNSHAFYKEWTDILMKCVAIVNHKCLFVGFLIIEKKWNKCLKNMTPGMVPWYDLTIPW